MPSHRPGLPRCSVARENASRALAISTGGVGNDQDFGFLKELAHQNGGAFVSYN